MMRKNRRLTKRNSILYSTYVWIGGAVVAFLVSMLVYSFVDTKCDQLSQSIGTEKNRLAALEKERKRESAHWEQMRTRAGLEEALRRHGLAMDVARPDHVVRIGADGTPLPSQASVAKIAKNREVLARIAANTVKRNGQPQATKRR